MKQLYKTNLGFRTEDVPIPTPGDNEVLVRVGYSLISTGTETSGLRKKSEQTFNEKIIQKRDQFQKVLAKIEQDGFSAAWDKVKKKISPNEANLIFNPIGYSNAGVVIEAGMKVNNLKPGDRVACAGSGIAAHAEFVTVPVNLLVKVPDSLSLEDAAFTTVASIALQGFRRLDCMAGETVVIYGLGLLGLIAVQIGKAYGYKIAGVDLQEERASLALKLGADISVSDPAMLKDIVGSFTQGHGADAVIVYAASKGNEIINSSIDICRRKGKVVLVGAVGMVIDREEMYKKEVDVLMSTSYGPGRYDENYEIKGIDYPFAYVRWTENRNMQEAVRLLSENRINTKPLISNKFKITDAVTAFNSLLDNEKKNIGVIFEYHNEGAIAKQDKRFYINKKPIVRDKINVGLIGAGGFAIRTHLPNIQSLAKLYNIHAIAEKNPIIARKTAEKFDAAYSTTNYLDILDDGNIDMVVITTRHDLHARLAIEAIKKNKHVLVEKPLAIYPSEIIELEEALKASDSVIRVGFNRRYSPLVQQIKNLLEKQPDIPVFLNYRINAGYISPDHWTQDRSIGGGRIIGEFCHFIDLVNYLAASPVSRINAIQIPVDNKHIFAEDNVCVSIGYKNGSVAQVSYVSIGGKDMPKERLEVLTSNKSMVIHDFIELEMFNTGMKNVRLSQSDKGHLEEVRLYGQYLKTREELIPPFEQDIISTELTFQVLDMLRGK